MYESIGIIIEKSKAVAIEQYSMHYAEFAAFEKLVHIALGRKYEEDLLARMSSMRV